MSDKPDRPQRMKFPPCKADAELANLVKARYTLIYAVTWEEHRVVETLEKFCEEENLSGVQVWDAARGLSMSDGRSVVGGENLTNPNQVLGHIAKKAAERDSKDYQGKAARGPIYVLHDLFRYLCPTRLTPDFERRLKNLASQLRMTQMTVVVTSPELEVPTGLEKCMTVMDYPLPTKEQVGVTVHNAKQSLFWGKRMAEEEFKRPHEDVTMALLGLTIGEAEDCLAKSFVITKRFDVRTILEYKRQVIRKGQLLDYICAEETLNDVGGFLGVKEFIRLRKAAYTEAAQKYGLPSPKGVFLLGVQGTGKSLCAKAIANEMGVPLLKMDMGRMFDRWMGESEARMARAIQLAESVAPCVLFCDEIDKALSGATGVNTDSGTTKRVISKLIDWMQEKTSPVFMVGCANSLEGLPPALLRRGRFDELFFVDFPTIGERETIFGIHLSKRGRDPSKFGVEKLVAMTEEYTGAEIEAVIVDAMFSAFSDGEREFTTEDIERAIKTCVPLAHVMKEQIDELREGARDRMRPAGKSIAESDKAKMTRFDV